MYGIDNHFQYHLINYNDPNAYAVLTFFAPPYTYGDDDYELFTAIPALCL